MGGVLSSPLTSNCRSDDRVEKVVGGAAESTSHGEHPVQCSCEALERDRLEVGHRLIVVIVVKVVDRRVF